MFTARPSDIHGNGCFLNSFSNMGDKFVIPAYRVPIANHRTIEIEDELWDLYPPFCFLNHSDNPNAKLFYNKDHFILILLDTLDADEEVTINYSDIYDE